MTSAMARLRHLLFFAIDVICELASLQNPPQQSAIPANAGIQIFASI
jgi:hypothetical protein